MRPVLWPTPAGHCALPFGAVISTNQFKIGAHIEVDGKVSRKKQRFEAPGLSADATWTSIPLSGNLYLNRYVDEGSTLYVGGGPSFVYTKID